MARVVMRHRRGTPQGYAVLVTLGAGLTHGPTLTSRRAVRNGSIATFVLALGAMTCAAGCDRQLRLSGVTVTFARGGVGNGSATARAFP